MLIRPADLYSMPGRRRNEQGQALAELSIVFAIILVLVVALFDLSLGFLNSTLLVHGARDGARTAMDCSATVAEIQAAALAAAPAGAIVVVSPSPRPTCPPSNSSDAVTTVTVTFTHQWLFPFWGGGGDASLSETATSR